MATLKDVAKLANVDVSTVSRALNNTSYVHPETKAKIMACAKELGYRPNAMAQALRQGRMHTIGVVVPRLRLTIFSEIISGIDEQAQAMGYTHIICITKDVPEIEKECLNRLRGSVDGIIIAATGKNGRLLRDISASGIPVVQVIRRQERKLSSIVSDNEQGSYEAIKFLAGKGSRVIGLVNGPTELGPYAGRLAGYKRAMEDLDLEIITSSSDKNYLTFDYGYECAMQLLEDNPDLDAIVAATDIQGIAVMRAVKDFGKRVPDDIRVLSLTGHRIGKMLETTMTSMEVPAYEIGNIAVKTLISEIDAPADSKPSVQQISYMPTLVEREST